MVPPPRPYESILVCPFCGQWIHRHHPDDPPFDPEEAERACEDHFSETHPIRWWLYERTGWSAWLSGWWAR